MATTPEYGWITPDDSVGNKALAVREMALQIEETVKDNFDSSGGSIKSARVRNSSTQTVTGDTSTALTFNTETFDYGGFWASSPSPTRLIVPSGGAGLYHVTGSVSFSDAVSNNTRRAITLHKNGTGTGKIVQLSRDIGQGYSDEISDDVVLADGDYMEIKVNTGEVLGTDLTSAVLSMHRVGIPA